MASVFKVHFRKISVTSKRLEYVLSASIPELSELTRLDDAKRKREKKWGTLIERSYLFPLGFRVPRRGDGVGTRGDAELHDPLGGLRRVPALLHELGDLRLGEPQLDPHGARVGGGARLGGDDRGGGAGPREGHVGGGASREHEALEALPCADAERPGPGAARRGVAVVGFGVGAGEVDEEVELPRLERGVGVEGSGAESDALDLLGLEHGESRVVSERVQGLRRRLQPQRRPVDHHHLRRAPLPPYAVPHLSQVPFLSLFSLYLFSSE
ncbi:hypothetical protein ACMD2_05883 [Ananas comosus]|uniref:Uncharacterized protein n=1 Tax=Ananas comosus TaxID=4615 RepID=A0A199UMY7_ANACO|nr:hypothetical protein ACMD2_05883 [Ananas comosus]